MKKVKSRNGATALMVVHSYLQRIDEVIEALQEVYERPDWAVVVNFFDGGTPTLDRLNDVLRRWADGWTVANLQEAESDFRRVVLQSAHSDAYVGGHVSDAADICWIARSLDG